MISVDLDLTKVSLWEEAGDICGKLCQLGDSLRGGSSKINIPTKMFHICSDCINISRSCICIYLHPNFPKTLPTTHLKTCRSWFARWYISLIVDFKFRHHSDDSLNDKSNDVWPHLLDVYTFSCQPVQNTGESALAACVLAVWVDEVATVDIEGVVCQVHKDMTKILLAWLLHSQNESDLNYIYATKV